MSGIYRGVNSSAVADAINIDGDRGDIVITNSGADWVVDENAVTFAKMQDLSADVLIGNTGTPGNPIEIPCTAAGRALLDDASNTDQRTTLGLGSIATQTSSGVAITGGTINGTTLGDTTPSTGSFTTVTTSNIVDVNVNSTSPALTITQTGTGNAFVVEDSASTDSTPFVIDGNGDAILGYTSAVQDSSGTINSLSIIGANNNKSRMIIGRFAVDNSQPIITFAKSRATAPSQGIVLNGNILGSINFDGSDGTGLINSAQISAAVDGTPGTNDMPGRLVFSTTADGASTPTERMRIDSAGLTKITGTAEVVTNSTSPALTITQTGSGHALVVEDSASPDSTPFVIDASGNVIIGSTSANTSYAGQTSPLEVASAAGSAMINRYNSDATGGSLILGKSATTTLGGHAIVANGNEIAALHFQASDGTQFLRGAAISAIVDGTPSLNDMPTRLTFSTTADGASTPTERMRIANHGGVSIGGTGFGSVALAVQKALTGDGGTTGYGYYITSQIQSDVTANAYLFASNPTIQAAAFNLANISHFYAVQGAIGAGASVTNQFGFNATSALIGATNNYGFFGNIPSGTGRWNFYANGTAPNYFAGDVRTNTVVTQANSPVNSNVSATLAASTLTSGIATGTPAAGINFTLPTGTNMDAVFQDLQTNQTFEWSVINLATATHAITVLANTAHTVVGNMIVAANSSGRFATRKTATNTFITYRLA